MPEDLEPGSVLGMQSSTRTTSPAAPDATAHRTGGRPPRRAPRLQTGTAVGVTAVATALVLLLAGCSRGGGHDVGEGVTTKLNGSTFSGQVELTTTKVERVTDAAVRQFGLDSNGDDVYFAYFRVRVESGTFPVTASRAFRNTAWGLQADGRLQAGPELDAAERSALLQDACPDRPRRLVVTLRSGGTASGCSVLLAPEGSDVTAVSYLRAVAPDDGQGGSGTGSGGSDEDSTITWANRD